MKLSEAIRLGAMLKPQAFDACYDGRGTCAIGAAADAIGLCLTGHIQFPPEWEALSVDRCHVCGVAAACGQVLPLITHLNDKHRLTREQIADWVETIESQAPQADPRGRATDAHEAVGTTRV